MALPSVAQTGTDDVLIDMQQAYRKGDRKKLTLLLPQARGNVLEPWAAYWELKARLDEATGQEVQAFMTRYAGTYQEDRLRNDWLLLLGQRRDWTTFAAEHPNFRMGDDREVRCYAMAVQFLSSGADVAAEVRRNWYAQRDADDGCAFAADRLHEAKKLSDLDIWRKARLAIETNRPKAARLAAAMVSDDAPAQVAEISNSALKYLAKRASAASRTRKELVVLALIKLATDDPPQAAQLLDSKWSVHLTPEERNCCLLYTSPSPRD